MTSPLDSLRQIDTDSGFDECPANGTVPEGRCAGGTADQVSTGQEHHVDVTIQANLTGALSSHILILLPHMLCISLKLE